MGEIIQVCEEELKRMAEEEGPASPPAAILRNLAKSAVRHNAAQQRFELDTSAGVAIAEYRLTSGVMTIYHTLVPVALRGRGIGARVVQEALEGARRAGVKVVPTYWFVREFIDRNPQYADLLR